MYTVVTSLNILLQISLMQESKEPIEFTETNQNEELDVQEEVWFCLAHNCIIKISGKGKVTGKAGQNGEDAERMQQWGRAEWGIGGWSRLSDAPH